MNMERFDLQEKMNPIQRDMMRKILKVNEIPLAVLKRYFAIKKPLDRIDGVITPCELLRIAMDCGFNPDTATFDTPMIMEAVTGTETNNEPIKVEPAKETEMAQAFDESRIMPEPKEVEAEIEPEPETATPTPEPKEEEPHAIGTKVYVEKDDDTYMGRIVGLVPRMDGMCYTVEIEALGETEEYAHEDIEVA